MKKTIIIIVSVICVVAVGLGILYAVDMDRMKNNESVLFSTWGYEYTVPEQDTPLKAFERIEVGTKRSEIIKSFGEPDGELSGMRGDIYNTDGKRIIIYYDGGSITDATVMNVKIDDYNVAIDTDKFDGTELDQTQNETEKYSYEKIELSVVTSNEKNKRKILNVSELDTYVGDTYVGGTFNSNYDLYYYGLDEVNIVIDAYTSSLETALREGKTTLEDVIKKARFDCLKYLTDSSIESKLLPRLSSYDDGGTTEYMYENYTIIKMNTLNGDRDIYICSPDVTLNDIQTDEETSIEEIENENFTLKFYDKQPETDKKLKFIINKSETDKYDYNVYSYQGNVNIVIDGNEMILRDALLENKITIDDIIEKANNDANKMDDQTDPHLTFPIVTQYRDGGTTVYAYKEYTIIKMHTLDGDRDVYIGTPDMTLSKINEHKSNGNGLVYEE